LTSLLLQGSTIAWSARRLGVVLPDPEDEAQTRAVFGDFVLDASVPVGQLCAFYGLPTPDDAEQPVGAWLTEALHRPPVVGDSTHLGHAELSVRSMEGRYIQQVGIRLE
jgi:cell volume regulation protein A